MAKNKKKFIRLQSLIVAANLTFLGYTMVNLSKPILTPSPYNGNSITIDSDELNDRIRNVGKSLKPQLSYSDIDEKINSMTDEQKKALLLLDAIYQNSDYTDEDLRNLKGYTQYLLDNKYVNYENIYKMIKSSKLDKQVDLPYGIVGIYLPFFNKIAIESYDSLKHEFFHLENYGNHSLSVGYVNHYNYIYQNWFDEGFTEILAYEYTDKKCESYPVACSAIRLFTEFVGPDKMFETRSNGNLDILVDALVNKGAKKSDVEELFAILKEHHNIYREIGTEENTDSDKINMLSSLSNQISNKFITIYNQIYNTPEIVPPIIIKNLTDINENKISNIKYYLFNSNYKKQYPYPESVEKPLCSENKQGTNVTEGDCYFYRVYYPDCEILYEYSNGEIISTVKAWYKQDSFDYFNNGELKNK